MKTITKSKLLDTLKKYKMHKIEQLEEAKKNGLMPEINTIIDDIDTLEKVIDDYTKQDFEHAEVEHTERGGLAFKPLIKEKL